MHKKIEQISDWLEAANTLWKRFSIGAAIVVTLVIMISPMLSSASAESVAAPGSFDGNSIVPSLSNDFHAATQCQALTTGAATGFIQRVSSLVSLNLGAGNPAMALTQCNCYSKLPTKTLYNKCIQEVKAAMTQKPSAVDVSLQLIDFTYQEKPASGVIYAMQMTDKVTKPGQVYAAGSTPYFPGLGFTLFQPIQAIWGWSVNFIYGFMILIILGVAFALLFQSALNGAQYVQLQTAIPNLIIAMVLIPLSYPITAFAVDVIAIGSNLTHGVLLSGDNAIAKRFFDANTLQGQPTSLYGAFSGLLVGPGPDSEAISTVNNRGLYIDDPRISVWRAFSLIGTSKIDAAISDFGTAFEDVCSGVDLNASPEAVGYAGCTIVGFGDSMVSFIADTVAGTPDYSLYNLIFGLLYLIISFMAIFTAIRLFWKLFVKYILWFLVIPIGSPFIFASIAVPGQGTQTIVMMMKKLYGTSVLYIWVYAMFLIILVVSQANIFDAGSTGNIGFIPPLLGIQGNIANTAQNSLTAKMLDFSFLLNLVAFGMYFALPTWFDKMENYLGTKFELPELFRDIAGGFAASAGAAAVTSRFAYTNARAGVSQVPKLYQGYRTWRDEFTPIGQETSIEKDLDAAKGLLRKSAARGSQRGLLGKTFMNPLDSAVATARAQGRLVGTGKSPSDISVRMANSLEWHFESQGGSESPNIIRLPAGQSSYPAGTVKLILKIPKVDGAGNRFFGEVAIFEFENGKATVPATGIGNLNLVKRAGRGTDTAGVLTINGGDVYETPAAGAPDGKDLPCVLNFTDATGAPASPPRGSSYELKAGQYQFVFKHNDGQQKAAPSRLRIEFV